MSPVLCSLYRSSGRLQRGFCGSRLQREARTTFAHILHVLDPALIDARHGLGPRPRTDRSRVCTLSLLDRLLAARKVTQESLGLLEQLGGFVVIVGDADRAALAH